MVCHSGTMGDVAGGGIGGAIYFTNCILVSRFCRYWLFATPYFRYRPAYYCHSKAPQYWLSYSPAVGHMYTPAAFALGKPYTSSFFGTKK